MKDCEDCTKNTICTYYDKEQKKASGNCPGWRWYRKCWIILILIALLLSGCVIFEHTDKAGNLTRYFRLGSQSIGDGSVTLADGSVLNFEKQESAVPVLVIEIPGAKVKSGGKQ